MINGNLVIDAVVHPWNMAPENQNPESKAQIAAVHAAHLMSVDDDNAQYRLADDEIFRDIDYDTIARAEFVESPVDFAVIHSLPNLGFGIDYITDPDKAVAFRDAYPDRCITYGTVDTPITATAIEQLERQVGELGIDGLKLYPAFFYDGKGEGWRLDGQDFATPLLEACQRLGVKHVAVHKALWLEPAPEAAFAIDDMDAGLSRFPDIQFEMVHGGVAFLDQTIALMQAHPNLFLTLETTFQFLLTKPRVFDKIFGSLITQVGSDRLLFASGNNLGHPAPLLEKFIDYSFSEAHIVEFQINQLTEKDRANILGLNAARLHGLVPQQLLENIADDKFQTARNDGIPQPWSGLRGD